MHDSENSQHFCIILSLFRFFDYFPQGSYFLCVCGGGNSAEWFIVQIFFILPKCFAYENSRRLIG